MKDIILSNVELKDEERCAIGEVDYDREEFKQDSAELQELVKKVLEIQFKFKASKVKVYAINDCRDGFRAEST